jgi:hypothetical protein
MLERFLAGESGSRAGTGAETATLPSPLRSRRWPIVAAALLLAAGAVTAGVLALGGNRQREETPLAQEEELKVRLSVRHVRIVVDDGEKKEAGEGVIGEESFSANVGDAVRLSVDLSAPAHAYLVAFNADGQEQLLWPTDDKGEPDESAAPLLCRRLAFPAREGKLFYLDDDESGGLQLFVVLASRRPLPPWSEWRSRLGRLPWRKHKPGDRVWLGDLAGTYPRSKGEAEKRGTVGDWPGMPPLLPLARALHRAGVEQVEMLAFPVKSKEVGR